MRGGSLLGREELSTNTGTDMSVVVLMSILTGGPTEQCRSFLEEAQYTRGDDQQTHTRGRNNNFTNF